MAAIWDCIVKEASARLFGFLAHGMFVFLNPYQFSYLPFLNDIFIEVMEKSLGKGSRRDFCNIPDSYKHARPVCAPSTHSRIAQHHCCVR